MPEFVIEEALHANGQDYDRCRAALREMFPNARARVTAQPAAATRVEAGPVARQRVSRDVGMRVWLALIVAPVPSQNRLARVEYCELLLRLQLFHSDEN